MQQTVSIAVGTLIAERPIRVVTEPGLNYKIPLVDNVIHIDKRILDLENPAQEVFAFDQKRLLVDAFARYRIVDAGRAGCDGGSEFLEEIVRSFLRRAVDEALAELGELSSLQVLLDRRHLSAPVFAHALG